MTLLLALSRLQEVVDKRRRFLLPESANLYRKLRSKLRQERRGILTSLKSRASDTLTNARDRVQKARKVSVARWDTVAEAELARRTALNLRNEAKELRKKARPLKRAVIRMKGFPWQIPFRYEPERDGAPLTYWSISTATRETVHQVEVNKIVSEGEIVFVSESEPDKYQWVRQRRIIRYRNRNFLARLSRRLTAAPHAPWSADSASESMADMTEEELRAIAMCEAISSC